MADQKESNLIECPVCFKQFNGTIIESHVSKCLFLLESTNETKQSSKRARNLSDDDQIAKKSKHDIKSEVRSIDTKPNILASSSDKKQKKTQEVFVPLAERVRPTDILSYIGQSHVIGPQTTLYQLLIKNEIPNIILWGPPGCGKTSLANVIANICKCNSKGQYRFVKLSAAMANSNEVKEAITIATNEKKFGRHSVIFLDEIHRFNKIQQDIFLPHIESGVITLIGATTENPTYSLNSALLSRCRVIILDKLSIADLVSILENAVSSLEGSVCNKSEKKSIGNLKILIHYKNEQITTTAISTKNETKFLIDKDTVKWLAETSDGDARIALGGLELAIKSKVSFDSPNAQLNVISLDDIKENLKKTHMLYDKKGDQHYDLISALHKSVRASNVNAALYWLTRMITGGEDSIYIARRLVRMASEDIGLADPKALGIAVHTMQMCKMMKMDECHSSLAQCTVYLAKADKSRLMEDSLRAAQRFVSNHKGTLPPVPFYLRDNSVETRESLVRDSVYDPLHRNQSNLTYLPDEIEDLDFFEGE